MPTPCAFSCRRLGARFLAGDIDEYVFRACVFRTGLIADEAVLARVDARLARRAPGWAVMGRSQLAARIDKIVAGVDLDVVRRRADRLAGREVTVGDVDNGLAELNAILFSADAFAVAARLTALAHTVCEGDPRSLAARRADAFAALAAGAERMSCRCRSQDCPAAGAVASAVVIHVIAEQATLTGAGDAPVMMPGYEGLIPAEMIAQLARDARIRPLFHPGAAAPENSYRPSRALAEFVRCRDVTCRFPGCDVPAHRHRHRSHHRLRAGWADVCVEPQVPVPFSSHAPRRSGAGPTSSTPNGTIVWTSPAGQRIRDHPGQQRCPAGPVCADRRRRNHSSVHRKTVAGTAP